MYDEYDDRISSVYGVSKQKHLSAVSTKCPNLIHENHSSWHRLDFFRVEKFFSLWEDFFFLWHSLCGVTSLIVFWSSEMLTKIFRPLTYFPKYIKWLYRFIILKLYFITGIASGLITKTLTFSSVRNMAFILHRNYFLIFQNFLSICIITF